MPKAVEILFYDGKRAQPYKAMLIEQDEKTVLLQVFEDGDFLYEHIYHYQDMILLGAVGNDYPVIELVNDERMEFKQALPDWFNLGQKELMHSIWKLERTPALILLCLGLSIIIAIATVRYGIPSAASHVASQLPENTMVNLGDQAEEYLMEVTEPSKIPETRQRAIRQQYEQKIAQDRPAKIVFRQGGRIGANALAIPNHTIVLTDELVKLAKNDQELLGVLAHEQGHLIERHSLQQALTGIGMSVLWVAITGDASDLLSSVPAMLINNSYSRKFELSADQYALHAMAREGIPKQHFSNFLVRLNDKHNDNKQDRGFIQLLSTHPTTQERVQAIEAFDAKESSIKAIP